MAGNSKNKILPETDDTQAEALPLPGVFDAPGNHSPELRAPKPTRQRGRPKGALNKRTEAVRDTILDMFGDPAVNLAEAGSFTIPDIKKMLGCTLLEAARFWRDIQNDLMPYVHSKRPQGVTIETPNVAPVQIVVPLPNAKRAGSGLQIENPTKSETYKDGDENVTVESSPLVTK